MKLEIQKCYDMRTGTRYCGLARNCKGWGCKHLLTTIDELTDEDLNILPIDNINKSKLFAKVYKEAKEKGVLECPAYKSIFIDKMLENLTKENNEIEPLKNKEFTKTNP